MIKLRFDDVRSVLCLGCHADDIEIGCGATIMRMLAENPSLDVHWIVLSADAERADEARRSAEGFLRDGHNVHVVVKDFPDATFPFDGPRLRGYLEEVAATLRPDIVFTHRREDLHQDHRLVSELTWCLFRDHLILEYEIPKYEGDLGQPNLFIPLDEDTCRRKVELLVEVFESQTARPWFSKDLFWSLLRLRGVECHSPSRFAEGLYCRKMTV